MQVEFSRLAELADEDFGAEFADNDGDDDGDDGDGDDEIDEGQHGNARSELEDRA